MNVERGKGEVRSAAEVWEQGDRRGGGHAVSC